MAKRVESPSSINTFQQCNRKYYYQYIEKLPTKASIHTVRGNIAHSVLEEFYNLDTTVLSEQDYEKQFKIIIQKEFLVQWGKYKEELFALKISQEELAQYFEETLLMLLNWGNYFLQDFKQRYSGSLQETFQKMKPVTEMEYSSDVLSVRGFVDAIHSIDDEVHIVDYKTNAHSEIKASIKLQLGIYSLLYQEKHGKIPDKVGVFFLKDKLYLLPVDQELLENAKRSIASIHEKTSSSEVIQDYKKHVTPLCKWRTGQCDFYEACKPYN